MFRRLLDAPKPKEPSPIDAPSLEAGAEVVRSAVEECRARVTRVIDTALRASESGVYETGRQLGGIASASREQVDDLRGLLPRIDPDAGGADSVSASIERQVFAMDAFVGDLRVRLDDQARLAERAAALTGNITRLASQIRTIERAAHFLTLNAKVEATRLGHAGRSLAVIADELRNISGSIKQANESIAATASDLLSVLPTIARETGAARDSANEFAQTFDSDQNATRTTIAELLTFTRDVVLRGEQRSSHILEMSREGLSQLQFQDPMKQDLIECERVFFEVARAHGAPLAGKEPDSRLGSVFESSQEEAAEDGANHGEVLLF